MQLSEKLLSHPAGSLAADNLVCRDAHSLLLTGLADILVFFGILLVGFAYVWKRGDLDWVRAITNARAQKDAAARAPAVPAASADRARETVA
jgi:NADH-quinone oxidoreductase subunit A